MTRSLFKFCGGPLDGEQRLMELARSEEVTVKAIDWSRHVYRFDRPNWGLSYVGKAPEENFERRAKQRDRRVGQPDRRAVRAERRLGMRDRRAA
jgi:hypothetical protein